MRFHTFKASSSKYLLIADSQGRNLTFPNFNILSIPGAKIRDARTFLPPRDRYDIIVLFVGGNDLFQGKFPSAISTEDVAKELICLANEAASLARQVFVIGIPPRHGQVQRTKSVNSYLANSKDSKWLFRGISRSIYSTAKHTGGDDVHLEPKALSGIRSILKLRILRKLFSLKIDKDGHLREYSCPCNQCYCTR